MSSTFGLICLAHQPAILLEGEYSNARGILDALAAGEPATHHPHCDLIAGRWSGGLIELACLPSDNHPRRIHAGSHRDLEWVDASWLRLLLLTTPDQHTTARIRDCWTVRRLAGLSALLGLEEPM